MDGDIEKYLSGELCFSKSEQRVTLVNRLISRIRKETFSEGRAMTCIESNIVQQVFDGVQQELRLRNLIETPEEKKGTHYTHFSFFPIESDSSVVERWSTDACAEFCGFDPRICNNTSKSIQLACRSAVKDDVLQIRETSDSVCQNCGSTYRLEVDHKDTFMNAIINKFHHDFAHLNQEVKHGHFVDHITEGRFLDYHRGEAKLHILCHRCNSRKQPRRNVVISKNHKFKNKWLKEIFLDI